jgi:hypothetical protein
MAPGELTREHRDTASSPTGFANGYCPMNPSPVQLPMVIVPPLRHTRSISAAASSGRGANIAPKMLATTARLASA